MVEKYENLYQFVQAQEGAYKQEISIFGEWPWNFANHIKQSVFYLFGRLMTGNDDSKPVKNIVRRIIRFRYAAEDIDVKDINIYVNDADKFHLSFLVKKYHDEVYVKENKLDKLFDSVKKEKINFGGCLVQKKNGIPLKVPLQNIAFCDQTNLMASPFGIKMQMTPNELLEMKEKGWGDKNNGATISVDELIGLATYYKENESKDYQNRENKTPGKYAEVYLVWGYLPAEFAGGKEGEFSLQLHYITFLKKDDQNTKQGVSLFSKEDKDKERFKFIKQDEGDGLEGRAVGYGGVEELFEAQAWTNSSMIWKTDYLRAASKIIMQTADSALVARHPTGLKDLDNLEVLEHEENKPITQVDTMPRNFPLFENAVREWEDYAQGVSFATDPQLGEKAPSGTPFRAQERQVIQGRMPHEENVKELARFIEEIYNDWTIPDIAKKLVKGTKFLAELSRDEMEFVSERIVVNQTNKWAIEKILNGEIPTPEEIELQKETVRNDFMRGGNKRFLEILKDELKNVSMKVQVSVAGKNKDLGLITDKLSNIFRQIFANPAVLDDPRAQKIFQKIIEFSGLTQSDFSLPNVPPRPQLPAGLPVAQPAVAMSQPQSMV